MRAAVLWEGTESLWSPRCFEGTAGRAGTAPQPGAEGANWDAIGTAGAQPASSACPDPTQHPQHQTVLGDGSQGMEPPA